MKHIELFKDGFDSTVQEKIQPENWPYIAHDIVSGEMVYTLVPEPDTINYFYIESLEDNNVITLDSTTWAGYGDNKSKLEYSNNTTSWTSMNGVDSITINNGEYLYMRCIDGNICKDETTTEQEFEKPLFKTSTRCNIGGNINTVMFDYTYKTEDCILPMAAFVYLFVGIDWTNEEPTNYITDASKLVLPATALADYCYNYMFYGCISLTVAPELPATTLVNGCYVAMFVGCTSLNYIKCLATDISADSCTALWVEGVSASGTFVKHPNMNEWSRDSYGIPSGWTVVDAEL